MGSSCTEGQAQESYLLTLLPVSNLTRWLPDTWYKGQGRGGDAAYAQHMCYAEPDCVGLFNSLMP